MAPTSLALAAVAGTAVLAVLELVARRCTARANRGPIATTAAAVAVGGGAALVVAGIATVDLGASVGLLAAAAASIAVLAVLVVAGTSERPGGAPRP
jgi:hypothetical protein